MKKLVLVLLLIFLVGMVSAQEYVAAEMVIGNGDGVDGVIFFNFSDQNFKLGVRGIWSYMTALATLCNYMFSKNYVFIESQNYGDVVVVLFRKK